MEDDIKERVIEEMKKQGAPAEKFFSFLQAYEKLSSDYAEQRLFAINALAYLKGIPVNDGSLEWVEFTKTGSIQDWKRIREERLKKV